MQYVARGYCVSHLQSMTCLCRGQALLIKDCYAVKIGPGGNITVHALKIVDIDKGLYEIDENDKSWDLNLSALCDVYVLHDAATWVDEPITDPYLAIDYT